jgi:hypothetical protein
VDGRLDDRGLEIVEHHPFRGRIAQKLTHPSLKN